MLNMERALKLALSGVLAASALTASTATLAADAQMEQCAGIVKAGKNDCATSRNACHGHVATDADSEAWVYLPKGTCERLVGARLVTVKDPTPKK